MRKKVKKRDEESENHVENVLFEVFKEQEELKGGSPKTKESEGWHKQYMNIKQSLICRVPFR